MVNKNDNELDQDIEITEEKDFGKQKDTEGLDDVTLEAAEENKIKVLQQKIKSLEQEKQSLQDDLQRAKAEFLNVKHRLETDKEQQVFGAKVKFLQSLLPLNDSFQTAMSDNDVWEQVDERWRKGVEGIYSQLNTIFQAHDVSKFDPSNEEFDPHFHEALSEEPVNEEQSHNKVTTVIQSGFMIKKDNKETVLRPAKVVVGSYTSE